MKQNVREYSDRFVSMSEIEGDFDEDCPRCAAKAAGYTGWEPEFRYDSDEIEGMRPYSDRIETDKEYDRRRKQEAKSAAAQARHKEKQERELYEKLKQKFG